MRTRPDLSALRPRLRAPVVTRYAPSPTGYLHLGHVANAIYVWGLARVLDARVVLRVEDHDRIRCRPEYEDALGEDLAWLGFVSPGVSAVPQRARDAVYARALERLRRAHHVYACDCSRRDAGGESYPGTCRARGLAPGPGRGLRVVLPSDVEMFDDALLGPQVQHPATQCGDLLLRDRDGHWTYQFAATVDDLDQGVTLVIRGADLVASTGRQILLARMLGRRDPPVFLHHPLILNPGGEKLSKARHDTGVRDLRAAGLGPGEVIARAARAVGLTCPATVAASAVQDLFLG